MSNKQAETETQTKTETVEEEKVAAKEASETASTETSSATEQAPKKSSTEDVATAIKQAVESSFGEFRKHFNDEMKWQRNRVRRLMEKAGIGDEEEGDNKAQPNLAEELVRVTKTAEEASSKLNLATLQIDVERQARIAGFIHEEDAWRLLDKENLTKENIADQLKALAEKYPAMLTVKQQKKPDTDGKKGSSDGTTSAATEEERQQQIRERFGM